MPIYTITEMDVENFTKMLTRQPIEVEPLPERYWADERWLFAHLSELIEQYPDHWIVVYNQQVVGTSRQLSEARKQAYQKVREGEPLITFFIESKPYVY
ncbi:MAG: DUF5678 domain-containing protein [Anaerolineae bacterium]